MRASRDVTLFSTLAHSFTQRTHCAPHFFFCSYAMCSQLYSGDAAEAAPSEGLLGAPGDSGAYSPMAGSELGYSLQTDSSSAPLRAAPRDPRASVGAFTIFQLVQNGGSALWYLVSLRMPVHDAVGAPGSFQQIWVQVALLGLMAVTFVCVDRMNR
jgi:hypothetical protein